MSLAQAITTILGCFIVPSGLGWIASQVMHRAKVAAFRRGKEQALQQYADYLPETRVKLRESRAYDRGYVDGCIKTHGTVWRDAGGQYRTKDRVLA